MPKQLSKHREKSKLREYVESIVIAILLALVIRALVIQAFKIPSGSMIPTLVIGDHILVTKFIYGIKIPFSNKRIFALRSPKRGDVVVFRYPKDHSLDYIKRLIGEPGDEVKVIDRSVIINNDVIDDPWGYFSSSGGFHNHPASITNFGPVIVPKKGDDVKIMGESIFLNGRLLKGLAGSFVEEILLREGFINNQRVVIDEDYYLMMGDNRDNSRDGRVWGFVKSSELRGKALIIYWSWDKDAKNLINKVRWKRITDLIR